MYMVQNSLLTKFFCLSWMFGCRMLILSFPSYVANQILSAFFCIPKEKR